MKVGEMAFALVRDFLAELKREFREDNDELAKVVKLKKVEQSLRTIEEFI